MPKQYLGAEDLPALRESAETAKHDLAGFGAVVADANILTPEGATIHIYALLVAVLLDYVDELEAMIQAQFYLRTAEERDTLLRRIIALGLGPPDSHVV